VSAQEEGGVRIQRILVIKEEIGPPSVVSKRRVAVHLDCGTRRAVVRIRGPNDADMNGRTTKLSNQAGKGGLVVVGESIRNNEKQSRRNYGWESVLLGVKTNICALME